jgi:hypothetical protein
MSDSRGAPIAKPAAFLVAMSKQGMDKPQAVIRAEQAAETARRELKERQKRRRDAESLKMEREIPPEAREFLDQLNGRVRAAV